MQSNSLCTYKKKLPTSSMATRRTRKMNRSRSVLSRPLQLTNLLRPSIIWCRRHTAGLLEKVQGLYRWCSRTTAWFHSPRKVAAAIALATCGAATETVPFTGRTHLVVFSPKEARERDEATFAEFKKEHAAKILGSQDPNTLRVRRIAHGIITAAHVAFALKQQANTRTPEHDVDGLKWMDSLDWEVIVVKDDEEYGSIKCLPGAGKIAIETSLLDELQTDAEIAVAIAHEVGHVIARHSSHMMHSSRIQQIIHRFPYLSILVLPILRRQEVEADYIGMLIHAAAGYNPHVVLEVCRNDVLKMQQDSATGLMDSLRSYFSGHPSERKRLELLMQPKVLEEAIDLCKQVTGVCQG